MNKKEIIKNRKINPQDFLGKRFKPSLNTNLFFLKFFTYIYPKFKIEIDIKSVEWSMDKFYIMLLDKESGDILHLTIKNNFGTKKCSGVLCTDNICFGVHSEVKNDKFLKFLVYFVVKGNNIKFIDLLSILVREPKAKKEYYQIFWKNERPPFSIIQDWNYPLHKFRFLVHEGVMRNLDQSINLNLPQAYIHHSERECKQISPDNKDTGYHFFNFPGGFYNHFFDKYYYLTDLEKEKYLIGENSGNFTGVSTDLDENDIIMGKGNEKLIEAIDYIVENIEKNNTKTINFNCCCIPRVVGDDIYSVLKLAKKKVKIPFIFQGQLEKTPFEQKINLLEKYIKKIDLKSCVKRKNSISLFGFHENVYQMYLGEVLNSIGIKINTSFIPSIDVRLLPLMFESELFVFSPNNFQKEVFEYPFQSFGIKYITPNYPYSIKYSDDWINSISKEFGKNIDLEEIEKETKENYKSYVDYVKNNKYKIGIFLIGKKELEKFLNPDYMSNIDLVYFFEEMGFQLEFFIYDNFSDLAGYSDDNKYSQSNGNHNKIKEIIEKKSKKINYTFFSNEIEFENILNNEKLNLIYSDLYFDDRIISKGLNQISLKDFYVGYKGALRTIKGIINLCEMTFYKNYSKYFDN